MALLNFANYNVSKWDTFKKMTSYSMAFIFMTTSASFSYAAQYSGSASSGAYAQNFNKTDLNLKNGKLSVDQKSQTVTYNAGSNYPKVVFPMSPQEQLRKFAPKSLNELLKNEMKKVNLANKAAFSHSLRSLPAESMVFFMAMGAVVAGQLITNFSQNPIAMKQHIESSLSPVGILSFYTFMYSQGVTSNVLAMYFTNPNFRHMIPYLGMAVGSFMQTYMSSIASDPNIKACGKTMLGMKVSEEEISNGVDKDPCGKSYDYLVIHKKIWEFAPGIVSVLASAGISAAVQHGVTWAVLKITGYDLAAWLIPGSIQVKGLRYFLVQGLQIAMFMEIDHMINRSVTTAWKNTFDGKELADIENDINSDINLLNKSGWYGSEASIQKNLKTFKEKMAAWRMMNLSESYEAYQNWAAAIGQLTGMYMASYSFYNDFINEVKTEKSGGSYVNALQRQYPFYGINAKLSDDQLDYRLSDPAFVERQQFETIKQATSNALAAIKSNDFKYLYPQEQKEFKQVVNGFVIGMNSTNEKVLNQAILYFNKVDRITSTNTAVSNSYRNFILKLRNDLGHSYPLMEKGRGWIMSYADAPKTGDGVNRADFYRSVGIFHTPSVMDYLVAQMICGPDLDKGEYSIKKSKGFPSVFLPPTIKNTQDNFSECSEKIPSRNPNVLYAWNMTTKTGKYAGSMSYLLNQIRPSILGSGDTSNFDKWWKKNVDPQMIATFNVFAEKYNEVIAKMMTGIYTQNDSRLNRGPVHNGTMNAAFQEERAYLAILENIMKPSKNFDMNLEKNLTKTPTQALLKKVDDEFSHLNWYIKQVKVVTKGDKKVLVSPIENYQIENQVTKIQAALKALGDAMGAGNSKSKVSLTKAQRNVIVDVLENLQSLATEISMYGMMANAVSWDKINNLKQSNMEQSKLNNQYQQILAQQQQQQRSQSLVHH